MNGYDYDNPRSVAVHLVDPRNDLPMVPPGMSEEQMVALDGGTNWSGTVPRLMPGGTAKLLRSTKAGAEGMIALATVHVQVTELGDTPSPPPGFANDQFLELMVAWGSGKGGGESQRIDCAVGAMFTLPGTDSVEVVAILHSSTPNVGTPLALAATCHWGTSVSPKPVFCTDRVFVQHAGAPVAGPVPKRAINVRLIADNPNMIGACVLDLFRGSRTDLRVITYNNLSEPLPIVSGARSFLLTNNGAADANFILVWELAL